MNDPRRPGLTVLAVDDEAPALEYLAEELNANTRVGQVLTASTGPDALRLLQEVRVDCVFLDIRMPDLSGEDVARILSRLAKPPAFVFVTAYDDYAVNAWEIGAVDYVLKPVRAQRLGLAVQRVEQRVEECRRARSLPPVPAPRPPVPPVAPPEDDTIAIELGGVTRFISRGDVRYVEAQGDYARLHTSDASHLVRVPMATLETNWRTAGFLRIHRSYLVALAHVSEVRFSPGRATVLLGDEELVVSRRHTRQLRELLVRRSRPGAAPPDEAGPTHVGASR
jgi:DNA-binding LytR/AlgR family response regulator